LIARQPGAIRGFVSETAFWDVGTVADYWFTSWSFAQAEGTAGVTCGRRIRIDPTARVSRSILWDDVEVGGECVIDECVVVDGVRVPRGASYRRSILMPAAEGAVRTAPLAL
jgi:NDP-sugar pyrophosphorylase family protein